LRYLFYIICSLAAAAEALELAVPEVDFAQDSSFRECLNRGQETQKTYQADYRQGLIKSQELLTVELPAILTLIDSGSLDGLKHARNVYEHLNSRSKALATDGSGISLMGESSLLAKYYEKQNVDSSFVGEEIISVIKALDYFKSFQVACLGLLVERSQVLVAHGAESLKVKADTEIFEFFNTNSAEDLAQKLKSAFAEVAEDYIDNSLVFYQEFQEQSSRMQTKTKLSSEKLIKIFEKDIEQQEEASSQNLLQENLTLLKSKLDRWTEFRSERKTKAEATKAAKNAPAATYMAALAAENSFIESKKTEHAELLDEIVATLSKVFKSEQETRTLLNKDLEEIDLVGQEYEADSLVFTELYQLADKLLEDSKVQLVDSSSEVIVKALSDYYDFEKIKNNKNESPNPFDTGAGTLAETAPPAQSFGVTEGALKSVAMGIMGY